MTGVELTRLERRPERSYDEQNVATLVLPNGTLACSGDRAWLGAATRAVLALYEAAA